MRAIASAGMRRARKPGHRIANTLSHHGCGSATWSEYSSNASPNYLPALLAVHKVGGAYVPLDPSHPGVAYPNHRDSGLAL